MSIQLMARQSLPMTFQSQINECGLACLTMICNYHGMQLDIRTLRSRTGLAATATSVKQLLLAAEDIGLQGRALKIEIAELRQIAMPAILHWDLDHFVVLKKLTKVNSEAVIHDPAIGIRKYAMSELGKHCSGIALEFVPNRSFQPATRASAIGLSDLFMPIPGYFRSLVTIFLLSLLIQVLSILAPLYLQFVIDQGLSKGDMDVVFLIALLFVVVTLAKALVSYCRGLVLLDFTNEFGFHLVSRVFGHLLRLPLEFFEKRALGDIVSRFSSLEAIKQLLTQEMISAVVDGILSLITIVFLFLYSPLLALLVVCFVSLSALLRWLTIPAEKHRRQVAIVSDAKQQSKFLENIKTVGVTKLHGIERDRCADWQNSYIECINSSLRLSQLQLGVVSLQSLIFGLDHIATIYFGVRLVDSSEITLGQLMGFVFLKQHFSNSVTALLPKLADLQMVKLELERVADIVLEKVEQRSSSIPLLVPALKGRLELDAISFNYPGTHSPILKNLSVLVEPGDLVLVTGRSGCGKSTLLKLILGLQQPDSGRILFDNKSLQMLGLDALREQISAVLHGDALLAGDIAYNINLGTEPNNESRLIMASSRSGLHEVVCGLPLGYRTRVGELGNSFSAGQVQRLLIARALYRLPKILVLDEALSHLGTAPAKQILRRIRRLGITAIVVSHNPDLRDVASKGIQID